jgi:anti-anti-sigma factor
MTDPSGFRVEVVRGGADVRARLEGSLDAATVPAFLDALEPLAAVARTVTLDCRSLDFCDSSGLRGFVIVHNTLGAPGSFRLDGASEALRQMLSITGLTGLLDDGDPASG